MSDDDQRTHRTKYSLKEVQRQDNSNCVKLSHYNRRTCLDYATVTQGMATALAELIKFQQEQQRQNEGRRREEGERRWASNAMVEEAK